MKKILPLIVGAIFGVGLAMSGMTDTQKVIGFLDIGGQWQPDLLFVMIGAVLITMTGYFLVLKSAKPIWAESFKLPEKKDIDRSVLIGAGLFGIGWGVFGYCPGPVVASLPFLDAKTWLFFISMLLGMWGMDFYVSKNRL